MAVKRKGFSNFQLTHYGKTDSIGKAEIYRLKFNALIK